MLLNTQRFGAVCARRGLDGLVADMALEAPLDPARYELYGTFYYYEQSQTPIEPQLAALKTLGLERPTHANNGEALVAAFRQPLGADGRVGLDERGLLPGVWDQVAAQLPQATLVPGFDASEVADGGRPTFTVIGFGQHAASPNAVAGQRLTDTPNDLIVVGA